MFTTVYIDFSDAYKQLTPKSVVGSGRNANSSKHALVTYKNEEDPIKNKGAREFIT